MANINRQAVSASKLEYNKACASTASPQPTAQPDCTEPTARPRYCGRMASPINTAPAAHSPPKPRPNYAWMPTWLPELYGTRVRATGVAFCFNTPRFIAWVGPLVAGTLIAHFGGYSNAAMTVATIYLIGLASTPFLPETRGKPLP